MVVKEIKQSEVSQEQIEDELKSYYIECDKLLFIAQLLALKEELPEELKSEKYENEGVLEEIAGYIEELEKLVIEPNSPVGYLGYDLKSAAIMLAMGKLFPEAKQKVVEQLLDTYNMGKSEQYAQHRFYTTNWDRCVKFLYAYPDISREELPLMSSLLRHVAQHPDDVTSGPFLTIRSLIDFSTVELTDIGENYRNLFREEIMAKKRQTKTGVKPAQQQPLKNESVTTSQTITTECGGNKQEFNLVSDATQTVDEIKNEFAEELEGEDMSAKKQSAQLAGNIKNAATKAVKEINMSGLTPDVLENEKSWLDDEETSDEKSSKEGMSTTKKVLLGLGGIALAGGIGYAVYNAFNDEKASAVNGFDLV